MDFLQRCITNANIDSVVYTFFARLLALLYKSNNEPFSYRVVTDFFFFFSINKKLMRRCNDPGSDTIDEAIPHFRPTVYVFTKQTLLTYRIACECLCGARSATKLQFVHTRTKNKGS